MRYNSKICSITYFSTVYMRVIISYSKQQTAICVPRLSSELCACWPRACCLDLVRRPQLVAYHKTELIVESDARVHSECKRCRVHAKTSKCGRELCMQMCERSVDGQLIIFARNITYSGHMFCIVSKICRDGAWQNYAPLNVGSVNITQFSGRHVSNPEFKCQNGLERYALSV